MMDLTNKKIIVFYGGSGAGKSKLAFELRAYNIPECVSDTERMIRLKDGEKEGVNYYFKTRKLMEEAISNNQMAEYAEYGGKLYGLSKREVESKLSQYDIVYAVTELNGIKQLKEKYGDVITVVYIKVSPQVAEIRMADRGDTIADIEKRLLKGERDNEYENEKYADFIIDNNGTFEDSRKQLFDIVFGKIKTAI